MEPWYAATAYAYHKGGAAQLFNFYMDRKKVRDGDVMVYVGSKSKELAESFSHMYDIEVLSAKELRKVVNREKSYHYSSLMQLLWSAMPGVELSTW